MKEKPVKYAAAAGVVVIFAVIGAYLLVPQRQIAGSNNLSRQAPVLPLYPKKPVCQRLPGTPAGAGYVRIGIAKGTPADATKLNDARTKLGEVRGITLTVEAAGAKPVRGTARKFKSGRIDVPLKRELSPSSKAKICIDSLSPKVLSLYGEPKDLPDGTIEGRLAVTFLDADRSNLLSRLKLIARRQGFTWAGIVGSWALVPAALFFLLAAGLALRAVISDPEQRQGQGSAR